MNQQELDYITLKKFENKVSAHFNGEAAPEVFISGRDKLGIKGSSVSLDPDEIPDSGNPFRKTSQI